MLKKDKKPFTYTPGGIDLSEIRSPRMARRIERNANLPGVDEMPRANQPQHTIPQGALPPSALAAMQPALPVQVFPSAAPPPPQPPPPTKHKIPGPPPPPMPTTLASNGQQTYERPDMTRIIPENPMALLRKAPPVQRKTFLDELYQSDNHNQPATPPANIQQNNAQVYNNFVEQKRTPSPPTKTSTAQLGNLYIPPINNNNVQQMKTTPVTTPSPPTPPQRQVISNPQSPQSPALNKAPTPWLTQKHEKQQEVPAWAVRDPVQAQPSPPIINRQEDYSCKQPSPPIQKPEVPRPWAQQEQQNHSPRAWDQQMQPAQNQQQYREIQPRPQQQPQQRAKPVARPQTTNIPQNSPGIIRVEPPNYNTPDPTVERVYVTQPAVFQHPGPPQQTGNKNIPIQVERNSNQKPATPGHDRYVNDLIFDN